MASSTATLSAVLTLDDRASPGLVKTSQNTQRLGADLRSAGTQIATFSASLASLLITTGALDSTTGRYATAVLALTGAFISMIPALQTINNLLRTNATIQAFIATLKNPAVGIPVLALAGAAAATTGVLLTRAARNRGETASEQPLAFTNVQTIDLRGATIRGEDDINELSRKLDRNVLPRI